MDSVVKEYVTRILGSALYGPNGFLGVEDEISETLKEKITMSVLQTMVISGAAVHNYDIKTKVDQFLSTDRLVRHWSWIFPGATLPADRDKCHVLTISGKRARYFNKDWLTGDPEDPPPSWPS
jgi:hypothetical protein